MRPGSERDAGLGLEILSNLSFLFMPMKEPWKDEV